jgi:hypothetical protein
VRGRQPSEYTRLQHWQPAEGTQQNRNDPKTFQVIITRRITTWVSKAGKFPAAAEPN